MPRLAEPPHLTVSAPSEHVNRIWSSALAVDAVQGILRMADKYPIIDVRGRGLMCAVEFGGHDGGLSASPGIAAAITKAAGKRNMLLLVAGVALNALTSAAHVAQAQCLKASPATAQTAVSPHSACQNDAYCLPDTVCS